MLFDNGLFLRLEGGGKAGGNFWTFGVFLSVDGAPLRPSYIEFQRWVGEHRSAHARAYLTPRHADPVTRASFDSLAAQFGAKWIAIMLMERKPDLVVGPSDARWTVDVRFFAKGRVEQTAQALELSLEQIRDAVANCSTGCFAGPVHGS